MRGVGCLLGVRLHEVARSAPGDALRQFGAAPRLRPRPHAVVDLRRPIDVVDFEVLAGSAVDARAVLVEPRSTATAHPLPLVPTSRGGVGIRHLVHSTRAWQNGLCATLPRWSTPVRFRLPAPTARRPPVRTRRCDARRYSTGVSRDPWKAGRRGSASHLRTWRNGRRAGFRPRWFREEPLRVQIPPCVLAQL